MLVLLRERVDACRGKLSLGLRVAASRRLCASAHLSQQRHEVDGDGGEAVLEELLDHLPLFGSGWVLEDRAHQQPDALPQ
jgi:hypothetical protein